MLDATFVRAMLDRLDAQIAWLTKIAGQLESVGLGGQGAVIIEQQGRMQSLLELLMSMSLPSAPAITRELTVNAVTPTLLASNESQMYARYTITDDDPAQMMWVGDAGVLPSMGRIILAQTTIDYILPRGAAVYGICAVATISVRVSEGYDMVGMAQVLQPQG